MQKFQYIRNINCKNIKKGWIILSIILFTVVALTGIGFIALQNSKVQTYIIQKFTQKLSERTTTKFSVSKIEFSFFNKLILENVLLEDINKDTLFYTHEIQANIKAIDFRNRYLSLDQLLFSSNNITVKKDSTGSFNFDFLLQAFSKPNEKTTKKEWSIRCKSFSIKDAMISYHEIIENEQKQIHLKDLNLDVSTFTALNDTLRFGIKNLVLNDDKFLFLNHLNGDFIVARNFMNITNLSFESNKSKLNEAEISVRVDTLKKSLIENVKLNFRVSKSTINFSEIGQIIPEIKGMDQEFQFSGQISGSVNDLKGKNIIVETGENTKIILDFYANDVLDPEKMYLFIDLNSSQTTFNDLSKIRFPESSKIDFLKFPETFYKTGILNYKGNFSGFLSDFVAYGTLSSRMGILKTDLAIKPDNIKNITYKGNLITTNFSLGELLQNKNFGNLTFNGNVNGKYNKTRKNISGKLNGKIENIEAFGYEYQNIVLNGDLNDRNFDGVMNIDDPNLKFNFTGKFDFNSKIPVFDFNLNLLKAVPENLGLKKYFQADDLSFTMAANFSGDNLDNLNGAIKVDKGYYKNKNGRIYFSNVELKSNPGKETGILTFRSPFFDVDVNGKYYFDDFYYSLKGILIKYLPSLAYQNTRIQKDNKFTYQANFKKLDSLLSIISPGLIIETPFLLYGRMDAKNQIFELEGSIPSLKKGAVSFHDIFLMNKPRENEFNSKIRVGEFKLNNETFLQNITVVSDIENNTTKNSISWKNNSRKTNSGIISITTGFSRNLSSLYPHIDISGSQSSLVISDTTWHILPFSATIDSTDVKIKKFKIENKNQNLELYGTISKDVTRPMTLSLNNIGLEHLNSYLEKQYFIKGNINGVAGVYDLYNQKRVFSDLQVSEFQYKNQKIGDISLINQWDNSNSVIRSNLKILKNKELSFDATGDFNPKTRELDYTASLNKVSVIILETVIREVFSNFQGDASGKVRIHGKPDNILLDGSVFAQNAGLTIDYTKVRYNFSDSIRFKGNTIHFNKIQVQDAAKNKGVFDGTIKHQNFNKMVYNLSFNSPKINVFNTTSADNELFYGQLVANGNLKITGQGSKINMTGTATTLLGTNLNIFLEYESEIKKYDFIEFVSPETTKKTTSSLPKKSNSELTMYFTINAKPEAKAQLIYNTQIGDVIKAQGDGILYFGMDKDENISLSGNYTITKGDYLFTLQNVINKRFTVDPGSTLVWSGDPYNAIIDITAVYKLKASLYDLLVNNYENVYQTQRIPVDCKILLTENLLKPSINFKIEFPSAETRIVDDLQQYFSTDEELNKQMLSLLVLGKFYTPEYMRGTFEAQNPNLLGTTANTASELLSNQLSNWFSQINKKLDIGVNYRPGNQITNDEVELALSTQMFNDRVTINGNIGNNINPKSTNSNNIVGDFEMNVKLNQSGKIQFKAYNRSNNNLIYETSPYTQGIGFSFKEEYNTIDELFKKMTNVFRKNKALSP